jgi:16S rRNA (guanine(527)-N(7))-methyltransferase RsmG
VEHRKLLDSNKLVSTHFSLIERFRNQMNLIGRGDATVHFEDSAKGLSGLSPTGLWADLGSGAGFPGVMFAALYPDVTLELVDSRMKRTIFLDKVVAEGGAENTTVKCCRVETLPADRYDGVMARAFVQPDAVLAHADRLLVSGGIAVLFLAEFATTPTLESFSLESDRTYQTATHTRRVAILVKR